MTSLMICFSIRAVTGDENETNTGAVAGGVVGVAVIVAAVAVVMVFIFRKRSNANKPDEAQKAFADTVQYTVYEIPEREPAEQNGGLLEDVEVEETLTNVVESQDDVYENVIWVNASEFEDYVRKKAQGDYAQEFSQLPSGLTQEHSDARKPDNIIKNRFNGVYPYNHSRVTIRRDSDFFINASFIDGYKKPNAYIASLGPTAKAMEKFGTFWKMVWVMKSDVIVMLTNLTEPSGTKCEQYWPNMGCAKTYETFDLTCTDEDVFAEYTVRTFTITNKSQTRTVYQLHYTAWPDKTVPDEITSLIEFRQRVLRTPRVLNGPLIVHCSAGIGRTGTYIAVDKLTEMGEAGEKINIFDVVNNMRQQRVNMVQTLEQYIFLHKALVHTLIYNDPVKTVAELTAYIQNTEEQEWNHNFQLLEKTMDEEPLEETEARNRNKQMKDKNRQNSDVPGDRNRPRLYICRQFNSSDYINAVYVNGFKKQRQYILAQSPLQNTVIDFLCMIYQENCCCVVSVEDETLIGTEIGNYLGDDNAELSCGSFTVKSVKCDSKQPFIVTKLVISNSDKNYSGQKVVYHYQLTNWKNKLKIPSDASDFSQFVKIALCKAKERSDDEAPILVHCLDGAKRSGLFCAVGLLMEKFEHERQVSVQNTIRQLRSWRKKAIPNKEQLEFCYRCVQAIPLTSDTYYEFNF